NDPLENRVQAYVNAIETYVDQSSVYFGIVTFNDYAHRPTLVFTDNRDILFTAAEPLTNEYAGGGTNYEDAIQEMYQFIVDDLNAISNPVTALRTHYHVYWLSDGMPTFGTTDRPTLVANIEAVLQYLEPKVEEFRLNTLYLESSGEWETEDEIAEARQLLKEMAEAGAGTFTNIASGESFEFDINPMPQIHEFNFASALATNRHAYFSSKHPLPDSDADGVTDRVELELGLDPTNPDSDGDSYRDGLELKSSWLSPTRHDDGCRSGDLDSDGDGLFDCEEEIIGTAWDNPDTDGDRLPDGIEFMLNGSVLTNDPNSDADLDQTTDFTEVMEHLDPRTATSEMDKQRWAYQYQMTDKWIKTETGQICYTVKVDNVSVYQTLETASHPEGWQIIELVVAFEVDDGSGRVHFLRAKARAGLLLPDVQYPPGGVIEIEAEEFKPFCKTGGDNLPPQSNPEICNGIDDDNDGNVPESEMDLDWDGVRRCAGDCNDNDDQVFPGAVETCNEVDDNCDGAVDEGCDCTDGESRDCGTDQGACQIGTQTCSEGVWGDCQAVVLPAQEICNGADDDCDGEVDEDCPCQEGDTRPCDTGQDGTCQPGTKTCTGNVWGPCEEADTPIQEVCDGEDNDCDGEIDEECIDPQSQASPGYAKVMGGCASGGPPSTSSTPVLLILLLALLRRGFIDS
ncbi:MAG: hypothetical protein JRJ87_25120, partial [Deltaproteobacteria bacterium]|nr:hypothetical protein [Deltaproteobacteria bacterium]